MFSHIFRAPGNSRGDFVNWGPKRQLYQNHTDTVVIEFLAISLEGMSEEKSCWMLIMCIGIPGIEILDLIVGTALIEAHKEWR